MLPRSDDSGVLETSPRVQPRRALRQAAREIAELDSCEISVDVGTLETFESWLADLPLRRWHRSTRDIVANSKALEFSNIPPHQLERFRGSVSEGTVFEVP